MKPCKHPCCPDRGPCKKVKPKKNRTPIRPVSKKQQKRLQKYSGHKKKVFSGDNICTVALIENKSAEVINLFQDCQYWATEFHHPAGRIGDELLTDEGMKLCHNCHRVVEDHPKVAKELGLSKSRLTKT